LGIDPKSFTHLFLTHTDYDHTGGVTLFENAQIYLSVDEEQMITGKMARMFSFIRNFKIKRDYRLLHDNELVTVGAVTSPGHTPGINVFFD